MISGQRGERGIEGRKGNTGATGAAGADARYLGRKQTLALFAFVVLAFLLLAARSEINADHIRGNTSQIFDTQQVTCESSREILRKYNEQQNALIAIEKTDTLADVNLREARIEAYENGRIDPLPVCEMVR